MTRRLLGGLGRVAEHDIAGEVAHENSQHDPAVVGHEQEPGGGAMSIFTSPFTRRPPPVGEQGKGKKRVADLHHHKCIEALHRVQQSLDDMRPVAHFDLVAS